MRHGCDGLRGVGDGGGDRGRSGAGVDGGLLHVHRVSMVGMDSWPVLNVVVNLRKRMLDEKSLVNEMNGGGMGLQRF